MEKDQSKDQCQDDETRTFPRADRQRETRKPSTKSSGVNYAFDVT